jgi:transcriptional regulator with XRE-family HTH domain
MKLTESTITGPICRTLRTDAGLTQREFWVSFGVTQNAGSQYENGKNPLPASIRKLVYAWHSKDAPVVRSTAEADALRSELEATRKRAHRLSKAAKAARRALTNALNS